ncbi:MAG: cytochrome c [Verrucomicrobia bacterium]|nr:cytochrome c [Verrucomicrobiota bacterium]
MNAKQIMFYALIVGLGFARGTELSIELPPETGAYKQVAGVELAQAFCVQCHSVEYTAIQPPMPAKFWDAEVKKMREKYFAPVPPEMDAKLVEYLTIAYGTK